MMGGNSTYKFADTIRISGEMANSTRLCVYFFKHLRVKAGVIFRSLLFLVPEAVKSKIAGCLNWARPGLWGFRAGNRPVLPGGAKTTAPEGEPCPETGPPFTIKRTSV
jgi:hypothetical protein